MSDDIAKISVDNESIRQWYEQARPKYERLVSIVRTTLEGLLSDRAVAFLSVSGRTKEVSSVLEKISRKGYANPKVEIHDFAGVRVLVYIEADTHRAAEIVRKTFNVHSEKSRAADTVLGVDRIGYRSLHFVCDLGKHRCELPEFVVYDGILFEIQVRTVLQHAWAEIEHDRNYKFGAVLPNEIQRRLFLAAGLLEIADREFDRIATDIDEYVVRVTDETEKGQRNIEITSASLSEYLKDRGIPIDSATKSNLTLLISELRSFGTNTLADVDQLLSPEFLKATDEAEISSNAVGTLRTAMMYADVQRYFKTAWQGHWNGIHESDVAFLAKKFGQKAVTDVLEQCGIPIRTFDG